MDVIIGDCPLGAKCETPGKHEGKDVIIRCPWYTKLEGKDPQNGETIDEFRCAIAFLPILLVNAAAETRRGTAETHQLTKIVGGEKPDVKLTTLPLTNGQLPKELREDGK